jgi:NADPH:quinone reductase
MRTIEVTRFGGPEVLALRDQPEPVPGPGEVVVDVAVVPLLWLDTALRSGLGRDWFAVEPPYVPGSGVAGTVSQVGDGVDAGWVGRGVLTDTGQTGAYAERVAVSAEGLTPIPDELSERTAAALLTDGRTAMQLIERADPAADQRVLITGAAGGMGLLLVQLAKLRGARVVGAARGERKLAAIRSCGADAAVDYSLPAWTDAVMDALGGREPELVLDGVGGDAGKAALTITARGGTFSAHGAPGGGFAPVAEEAGRRGITVRTIGDVQLEPVLARRRLRQALDAAVAGRITPVVEHTYPLEDAAEAHRSIEAREIVGKALLVVDSRSAEAPHHDTSDRAAA